MTKDEISKENAAASIRTRSEEDQRLTLVTKVRVLDFFDIVSRCTGLTKAALYKRVWAAGLLQVFNATEEEIQAAELVSPRYSPDQRPQNLQALADRVIDG